MIYGNHLFNSLFEGIIIKYNYKFFEILDYWDNKHFSQLNN